MASTPHKPVRPKRKPMSPRRLLLIGALLTLPWFIGVYIFDAQDVLAALLALVGYVFIFVAAAKVFAVWLRQRKTDKSKDT